jgi:predicted thioesterase
VAAEGAHASAARTSFPPLVQNCAMSAAITPGLHAGFSYTVTDADTAAALGSGLVPVLSTPRVLALVERATVEALEGALAQGATTVGAKVELEHLLATPVGAPVQVDATLGRVDGRRLQFAVQVTDAGRVAARGRVTRVLVDLERFLAGVAARRHAQ